MTKLETEIAFMRNEIKNIEENLDKFYQQMKHQIKGWNATLDLIESNHKENQKIG